jgi:hypothetical protein
MVKRKGKKRGGRKMTWVKEQKEEHRKKDWEKRA